jgi:Type IV secretory system Conjugative DNA transfer
MNTRAAGPRASGAGDAMPAWLTLGAVGIGFAVTGAFWIAGALGSMLLGEGWRTVPFGFRFATRLVGHGPGVWWPTVNPRLITGIAVTIIVMAVGTAVVVVRAVVGRRPRVGDMFAALASPADVAVLTPTGVRVRAVALRPSLAGVNVRQIADSDAGLTIGTLEPGGPLLSASWEDVGLAIMAPRAGKTSSVAIPAALSAPGCLVVTENKAGLWAATGALRAERTGRAVWVFDPNLIARTKQGWWWNPLTTIRSYAEAFRFAGHFTQTLVVDEKRDFWTGAAQDLLAGLFLAAAVGERHLTVVYGWLNDSGNPEPERLLRAHGFVADAESLAGSGIDDAAFAEDISRLIGDHDVPVRTTSHGPGHRSDSVTVRRERVLPADRVRALQKGTAIVFATGARAALVKLRPWFEGPDKPAIEQSMSATGGAVE